MNWKPVDFIIVILTVTVCATVAAVIAHSISEPEHYNDKTKDLLAAIVTSIISIVSVYVGAAIQKGRDK